MGIGPPKKSDVAEGNVCVAGNCFWFVWREWPRETPSAFIDNEIDLLWHNEEKILKPKTPGCLEHKFCETNGYPVGNGTMEKTKIEHPQEAKWFTYWIRFYFGIGVWIVHTNLLF